MNISDEYHASVYRDLDADTATERCRARAALPCSECGSIDGMCGGWTRDVFDTIVPMSGLVLYSGEDDHQLFYPCMQCNPERNIPANFEALTPEQVTTWLARECTCPDCRRERKSTGTVS